MQKAYIGIDVSCGKSKRIAIVFAVKKQHRLVPLPVMHLIHQPPLGPGNSGVIIDDVCKAYAQSVYDYIQNVCSDLSLLPKCIALDSPLVPRISAIDYRVAERELNRAGISCYKTPSAEEFARIKQKAQVHLSAGGAVSIIPHSMQLWMLAGFEIARLLRESYPIIEVYPQATIRRLLPNVSHKSKQGVAEQQLNALSQYTGWPKAHEFNDIRAIAAGALHDKVDAYSAAWVASLPKEQREIYGDISTNDAIHVPAQHIITTAPIHSGDFSKVCPACKQFTFKRWPWGWDAHAAYKCPAVVGTTIEERKRWFKFRYLNG